MTRPLITAGPPWQGRTRAAIVAFAMISVLAPYHVLAQQRELTISPQMGARLDSLANAQLAIDGIGGMTIGIITDSGLRWTNSYGFADMQRHEKATRTTVYRIGSITKQFTALMLRQLAQSRVVRLSDPADRYYPALDSTPGGKQYAPRVTLWQLATMTSGLPQEPEDEATYSAGRLGDWEQTLAQALRHTKFNTEPGAAGLYSNIGYATLGAALARAARKPFVDYIRERILLPLGMASTGFAVDSGMRRRLATGYAMGHGTIDALTPRRELDGRGYRVPNGGLFSTVDDLAAFVRFEMGNGPESVLPRTTLKDHFASMAWAAGDLSWGYGVGFQGVRHGSIVAIGHPGAVAGYLAAAYFDPATHTGVVVLRNVDDEHFDVLGFCLKILGIAVDARK